MQSRGLEGALLLTEHSPPSSVTVSLLMEKHLVQYFSNLKYFSKIIFLSLFFFLYRKNSGNIGFSHWGCC